MFISLPDAKLYATSFGPRSGTPFLALNGWIGSWEDWTETLSVLSEQWRTISFDHRGTGASVASVASISFDKMVDDVFAVLDAYKVDQCVLAAMSMGAVVAFGAALREPDRFSGLVIVNGALSRNTAGGTDPFLLGLNQNYSQALDLFVSACITEENSEHIKRWRRQVLDRASREAAIALYKMIGSIDLRKDLGSIYLPTLVLHGEASTLVSIQSARWLAGTLPSAKLAVISGAGHVPTMTRPNDVAREIKSFFGTEASPLQVHTTAYTTAPLLVR